MNTDHLKIHQQCSLNAGRRTDYLVNTYYDYAQTYYFATRREAEEFVAYEQLKQEYMYNEQNI